MADDFGRFEADPVLILAKCFPLKVQTYKLKDISKWYAELEACEHVQTYVSNCYHYGFFTSWDKHQDRRAKHSKYPDPTSANICEQMQTYVLEKRDSETTRSETRDTNSLSSVEDAEASTVHSSEWGTPEALIELYNAEGSDELPTVQSISPGRIKKAREYLKAFPTREFWLKVFQETKRSSLLQGFKASRDHPNFRGDFDWLLTRGKDGTENCSKVWEGKYRDD